MFGRWQPRMLEPWEAAHSVARLLQREPVDLNLGNFKLGVGGTPEALELKWSRVSIDVSEHPLEWG